MKWDIFKKQLSATFKQRKLRISKLKTYLYSSDVWYASVLCVESGVYFSIVIRTWKQTILVICTFSKINEIAHNIEVVTIVWITNCVRWAQLSLLAGVRCFVLSFFSIRHLCLSFDQI